MKSTPYKLAGASLDRLRDERGTSLVSAMLVLSLFAVFALVVAHIASNEQRTGVNEFQHVGSYMSADSGGEVAIGWLGAYNGAPPIIDINLSNMITSRGTTNLHDHQRYAYQIDHSGRVDTAFGDGEQYRRHWYGVDTDGESGAQGSSHSELIVTKKVVQGY